MIACKERAVRCVRHVYELRPVATEYRPTEPFRDLLKGAIYSTSKQRESLDPFCQMTMMHPAAFQNSSISPGPDFHVETVRNGYNSDGGTHASLVALNRAIGEKFLDEYSSQHVRWIDNSGPFGWLSPGARRKIEAFDGPQCPTLNVCPAGQLLPCPLSLRRTRGDGLA